MKTALHVSILAVTGLAVGLLIGLMVHETVRSGSPRQDTILSRAHKDVPLAARIWSSPHKLLRLSLADGGQERVRSILNITKPMHFGNFVWNEDGIPAGPVWIRIDLDRQILSVFRSGSEIGSTVILYGTDKNPTPTGRLTILQKTRDYYSHSYHVPMPYTLLLTSDGVAIHGSQVREGWATHGCIGVPLDFARLLFAVAAKGDRVIIIPVRSDTAKGPEAGPLG